jgi:hypothetical protein
VFVVANSKLNALQGLETITRMNEDGSLKQLLADAQVY